MAPDGQTGRLPIPAKIAATLAIAWGCFGLFGAVTGAPAEAVNRFGWAQFVPQVVIDLGNASAWVGTGGLLLFTSRYAVWSAGGVLAFTLLHALWVLDAVAYLRAVPPMMHQVLVGWWLLMIVLAGAVFFYAIRLRRKGLLH